MQPPAQQHTMSQSPRHKRRHQQKARAKKAASQPSAQHQGHDMTSYCLAGRHGLKTLCQPHNGDYLRWTERLLHAD